MQNDIGNQYSETITIAPFLTSGNYPFIVNVTATSQNGLDKTRGLNLSKIRSVSRTRFNNIRLRELYWFSVDLLIVNFKIARSHDPSHHQGAIAC
ncbi:MAG: type II toxin-antitoxin system PemK/MazF family toxin [Pleurocapsa sp.]